MSALKDSIDFFLECVSRMPSGSDEGEEDAGLCVEEVMELQASMVGVVHITVVPDSIFRRITKKSVVATLASP